MNRQINSMLNTVRKQLKESVQSVRSFTNPVAESNGVDSLDSFMAESARYVARETSLSEDEAFDLVFDLAEAGFESGHLPALPSADASQDEIEEWLNAATDTGFTLQALLAVQEGRREDRPVKLNVPKGKTPSAHRNDLKNMVKSQNTAKRADKVIAASAYKQAGLPKKAKKADDAYDDAWARAKARGEKPMERGSMGGKTESDESEAKRKAILKKYGADKGKSSGRPDWAANPHAHNAERDKRVPGTDRRPNALRPPDERRTSKKAMGEAVRAAAPGKSQQYRDMTAAHIRDKKRNAAAGDKESAAVMAGGLQASGSPKRAAKYTKDADGVVPAEKRYR